MKSNRFLGFLLGVMPFGIIPVSNDSTEANFQLLGGAGQYALISRGCEGQVLEKHKIPFKEYGAAIDYKTASPVRLGVNSAYIFTREQYGSTDDFLFLRGAVFELDRLGGLRHVFFKFFRFSQRILPPHATGAAVS